MTGLATHSRLATHAVLLAWFARVLLAGFAARAVLATFTAFAALVGFRAVRCSHSLAPKLGTIVVCDCDASGECCAECEHPARDNRGEGDGLAVLRQC